MDLRDDLGRYAGILRHWLGTSEGRTLFPLFLIAMAGPLGEMLDVAFFLEMEVELLTSDLGLEVVSSLLVYGYQIFFALLAAMATVAIPFMLPLDGARPVRALASCRSRRPIKIPIH
jgi:hypothetical protein